MGTLRQSSGYINPEAELVSGLATDLKDGGWNYV